MSPVPGSSLVPLQEVGESRTGKFTAVSPPGNDSVRGSSQRGTPAGGVALDQRRTDCGQRSLPVPCMAYLTSGCPAEQVLYPSRMAPFTERYKFDQTTEEAYAEVHGIGTATSEFGSQTGHNARIQI